MRQNRRPALWAALALLFLCGCGTDAVPEARRSVALVAKSTETEFWLSAFAGAQAAAAEYNLELTISGPGTEEDYETQNKMIAQAVENGAEAIDISKEQDVFGIERTPVDSFYFIGHEFIIYLLMNALKDENAFRNFNSKPSSMEPG